MELFCEYFVKKNLKNSVVLRMTKDSVSLQRGREQNEGSDGQKGLGAR